MKAVPAKHCSAWRLINGEVSSPAYSNGPVETTGRTLAGITTSATAHNP
jgi:hypothetical protein